MNFPHAGHGMSVTAGPSRSASPGRGWMYLHGGSSPYPVQPTKNPLVVALYRFWSGLPHFGHISPVSSRATGMSVSARFSVSENEPQNSSSTSL